ncbi:MAG: family 78 glycoside hydrolase catalytic domain [Chloroflexi bacterium]|nr:family 78 glycoside hydrolase catalytic domain [Chloroflexota bacterium]
MAVVSNLTVERRVAPLGIDIRQPRFAWQLSEGPQTAYQVEVTDAGDSRVVWDSGRCTAETSTYVAYAGSPLGSRGRYRWRVRAWDAAGNPSDSSERAEFEMGLLAPEDWSARWISHLVLDTASAPEDMQPYTPAPLLRRTFRLSATPRRARLYITALGLYEASINTTRVGEERLAPGWTDYRARLQYQTYDATSLLRSGDNVLGVRLGDGWYAGSVGGWGRRRYGDRPALLAQLEVELDSGERLMLVSDSSWRTCSSGTWLDDLQLGERTDFRNEPTGWTSAEFDDGQWQAAACRAGPGVRLVASRDDGVRRVANLPAVSVQPAGGDRYIVDLGANSAGVLRLQVVGTRGQHVVIRHAEALDDSGELYVENLRGAEQRDEYILADAGPTTLEPRFTFHGFRYAELAGLAGAPSTTDLTTQVLSSASRLVGAFSCSDPRVEQLQRNIVTSLWANFISIPTDCPQRNERLGWTADLQIFAPTALFNADVTNMLDKWLDDMVDAQLPSGAYSDIAPAPSGWAGAGNTAWSDAGVIVPWILYQHSGDAGLLERMYASMRRFMVFLEADQTDGLRFGGRYGDWVSLGARTDKLLIGTAYLAYVADLFERTAGVLGRSADQQHYAHFARDVRQAFRRRFLRDDGSLVVQTQTAHALAIGFDLVTGDERAAAGERLAELVEEAGTHLATGFLGTPLVMPALSDTGHHELACRLLRQDTYPSWLFEVVNGATSIWERWNGWTPDGGFYSPRMNSFNHYAFGAVGEWMYGYLAGLQPVEPGYRRTEIRPRPGGGFTAARAAHTSLYGEHVSGWRLENGELHVEAEVPANTRASVVLPVVGGARVVMDGSPVDSRHIAPESGGLRLELTPGRHTLATPYAPSPYGRGRG